MNDAAINDAAPPADISDRSPSGTSRRAVVAGAAWAVPAIALAVAAPAASASTTYVVELSVFGAGPPGQILTVGTVVIIYPSLGSPIAAPYILQAQVAGGGSWVTVGSGQTAGTSPGMIFLQSSSLVGYDSLRAVSTISGVDYISGSSAIPV